MPPYLLFFFSLFPFFPFSLFLFCPFSLFLCLSCPHHFLLYYFFINSYLFFRFHLHLSLRRFRDFSELNSQVKQNFKGHHLRSSLPPFPEKHSKLTTNHGNQAFLIDRYTKLEVTIDVEMHIIILLCYVCLFITYSFLYLLTNKIIYIYINDLILLLLHTNISHQFYVIVKYY